MLHQLARTFAYIRMRHSAVLGVFLVSSFLAWDVLSQNLVKTDSYGGLTSTQWEKTGFFRTHFDGKQWWLVTPDGHPFLSIGCCSVRDSGIKARGLNYSPYARNLMRLYGTVERWREVTRHRLLSWGFNTLGGWSRKEVGLPWVNVLSFCRAHWLKGQLPDFFSEEFIANAEHLATRRADPEDKMLIGYFLDNEMQWDTDWRLGPPLFSRYVGLDADAAGKKALVHFFRERYDSTEELGRVWQPATKSWAGLANTTALVPRLGMEGKAMADADEFTSLAARQYFRVCTEALRKADPKHLILGVRFVCWTTPEVVVKACGEYCDVVSVNFYELGPLGKVSLFMKSLATIKRTPDEPDFRVFHQLTGKPLLISEFSFRANDSGLPNTWPPGLMAQPTVPTQKDRGKKYSDYVRTWAATNYVVGYHWFCYMDDPKEGRTLDGENGNYGLVNVDDKPYEDFIKIVTPANALFQKARMKAETFP